MDERGQLESAIAALEAQRTLLGDAVVEPMLAAARTHLASLASPPAAQRRLITVLFADVSGFTALAETLDPEDLHTLMNTLWDDLDRVITQHNGRIDKHIGDAIMALWGADQTREDDAAQAVHAALALQQHLAVFRTTHHLPLAMRIGLNTGLALVGAVGTTSEFTAMGDTVNVASRLEHAAPTDGILIAHATYRHVQRVVAVHPCDPLTVKGKSAPLRTYLVTGTAARPFLGRPRSVAGVTTPLVGRDQELSQLQHAFQQLGATAATQIVIVEGEAGVGKSRLLAEFRDWMDGQPITVTRLQARATPQSQRQPYGLLRDLVVRWCGIADTMTAAEARSRVEQGVTTVWNTPEGRVAAHLIGQLVGFEFGQSPSIQGILGDPQQLQRRALVAFTRLLQRLTQQQPVLLLVEDLHWADTASRAALVDLFITCQADPLLAILMTRPQDHADEIAPLAGAQHLTLTPLNRRQSRQLARAILAHVPHIPTALEEVVVQGAAGNPYYVEELITMLIDVGAIVPDAGPWQVDLDRLAAITVPATLQGVLQARLDGLDPAQRAVLQRASVLGRVFWDSAVGALADRLESPAILAASLTTVQQRALIFPRAGSVFAPAQEYLFKHALLREVVYESILKRERRIYHGRAAAWLQAQAGDRADEYAALIADHYQHAEDAAQAGIWYARAGDRASAAYANQDAITAYEQALIHLAAPAQIPILIRLGMVLRLVGQTDAAAHRIQAALRQAEQTGDAASLARAQEAWANTVRQHREYTTAAMWLQRARAGYVQIGDSQGVARTWQTLGWMALLQCNYPEAGASATAALAIARAQGDHGTVAQALHILASLANQRGEHTQSTALLEEARALARTIGDRQLELKSLRYLGINARMNGDLAASQALAEAAQQLCFEIGDRVHLAQVFYDLGTLRCMTGDVPGAQALWEEAIAITKAIGEQRWTAITLEALGRAALCQRDMDRAWSLFEEALASADAVNEVAIVMHCRACLGWIALGQERDSEAHTRLQQALAEAQAHRVHLASSISAMGVAWISLLQDRPSDAQAALTTAITHVRQRGTGWDTPHSLVIGGVAGLALVQTIPQAAHPTVLQQAVRLGAAATTTTRPMDLPLWPRLERWHDARLEQARDQLGGPIFTAMWAAGQELDATQALEEAAAVLARFGEP